MTDVPRQDPRIVAVVVTFNRLSLVRRLLERLATVPRIDEVVTCADATPVAMIAMAETAAPRAKMFQLFMIFPCPRDHRTPPLFGIRFEGRITSPCDR